MGKLYRPQLELWEELPPKEIKYWYIDDLGKITMDICWNQDEDIFRLKTKNCHKTQKSAEEALKRLLEK